MAMSFSPLELSSDTQRLAAEAGQNLEVSGTLPLQKDSSGRSTGARGCVYVWNDAHQRLWAQVKKDMVSLAAWSGELTLTNKSESFKAWAGESSQQLLGERTIVQLEKRSSLRTPQNKFSIVIPIDGLTTSVDIRAADGVWFEGQDWGPIQLQEGVAIRASSDTIIFALFRISRIAETAPSC